LAVATLPLAAAAVLATAASSTSNWNSGMVVFSRYGVFTAVPLVVGLAYSVDLLSTRAAARRIAASILAVFTLGQLVTVTTYGGFGSGVSYVRYSLASEWLLENFPRFYNPIPETFVERGARTEGLDKGKVFTFARNGQITKILFNEPRADMSISLCGQPLHALAGKSGFPSVRKEDGWIYVNPEAPCPTDMNDGFSIVGPPRVLAVYKGGRLPFAAGGAGPQYLLEGWSQPEPWGVWSDGNRARLQVPFAGLTSDRLRASLHMAAFDRGDGRGQGVVIKVGEASHELQLAGAPGQYHFEFLNPGGPAGTGTASITFDLPDATSPKSISRSNDPRQLGVALRDISIVESK
jgi:hypothetical protein